MDNVDTLILLLENAKNKNDSAIILQTYIAQCGPIPSARAEEVKKALEKKVP